MSARRYVTTGRVESCNRSAGLCEELESSSTRGGRSTRAIRESRGRTISRCRADFARVPGLFRGCSWTPLPPGADGHGLPPVTHRVVPAPLTASRATITARSAPVLFRTYPSHRLLRSHSPPYVGSNACKSDVLWMRRCPALAAPGAEFGLARLTPPDVTEGPAPAGIAAYERLGPSAVGTRPIAVLDGNFGRRLPGLSMTPDSRLDANGAGAVRPHAPRGIWSRAIAASPKR
jgi:hypothetical protein